MTPARILLADGHCLFREAVRMIVDAQGDLEVVAEADDGRRAIAEARRTRPNLVIIDANLPGVDGIRATREIKEELPSCNILVLAPDRDPEQLSAALENGASGFLTKESPLSELLSAARAVNEGRAIVPSDMLAPLLDHLLNRKRQNADVFRKVARLTKREKQVLLHLVEGADNGRIASALVISPETARTHIQNILGKLGVHSRLEATALVLQSGVLSDLVGV